MKKFTLIVLLVLAVFIAPLGIKSVVADGTSFSCLTITSPGGTVDCEAGTDFIRWTLSGVPRQNLEAFYSMSASVDQHALVSYDMTYVKGGAPQPLDSSSKKRYVVVSWELYDVGSGTYDLPGFYRFLGPNTSAGEQEYSHSVTYYTKIRAGTHKRLGG